MRDSSMTIRLCVLVLFITTVCQGAAAPLRLDCFTERNSDCIECICKTESLIQNCTSGPCTENILPERRKRQVEGASVNVTEAQPVAATSTGPVVATQSANATSDQPVASTSTEAQVQAEVSTSSAPTAASPIIPSLPPPPHPSSVQATAVKSRPCKSGSTWEEECNTCWCLDNGMAACTVKRCEVVTSLGGAQTTISVPPSDTTPASSTTVKTSTTNLAQSSTPGDSPSPTTSVLSETVPVEEKSTVSSSTSSVFPSSSLPISSTSPSGGTS